MTDGSFDLLFASGTHQLHNGLKQFFEGVLGASTFEVIEAEGHHLRYRKVASVSLIKKSGFGVCFNTRRVSKRDVFLF